MSQKEDIIRSPAFYVKKRLKQNIPALVGLFLIVVSVLVSILGYLIMPDSTPSANDGAVQIGKKPPGFTTKILKIKRNVETNQVSFLTKMLFGQESEYTIIPIKEYKINGFDLEIMPEGRVEIREKIPLIEIVKSIRKGDLSNSENENSYNYKYIGTNVQYIDINGKENTVSQKALAEEFKQSHLETRTYYFGTDKAGRDLLSRLIFGTRISLGVGCLSVFISLVVGLSLGSTAGYFGGRIDQIIMWLMTVVWSIPSIMLVIAISLALQSKGIWVAFVAVGLTTWVEVARLVRGQIMGIKEKTFIEAAKALGFRDVHIIFRHILPNLMGPIIVVATSNFASAILTEAGLSFLGLGVQPPMPSWGVMINEGFHSIGTSGSWHLVFFPSLLISLLVLAFNLFGNGLRDAYDPQTATKW